MAKIVVSSWTPRSYLHLSDTFLDLGKIDLKVADVVLGRDSISFDILDYPGFDRIHFIQDWSGQHLLMTEVSDDRVQLVLDNFLNESQRILLDRIIKPCHAILHKQILDDIISLHFHTVVLSNSMLSVEGLTEKKVGNLTVMYSPERIYNEDTFLYVFGSDDLKLYETLKYWSFIAVSSHFIFRMVQKMTRLIHEADLEVEALEETTDLNELRESILRINKIRKECDESYGKLRQAEGSFRDKAQEYSERKFDGEQKNLAQNLDIGFWFNRLKIDNVNLMITWNHVLMKDLEHIDSALHARLLFQESVESRKVGVFMALQLFAIATILLSMFVAYFTGKAASIYLLVVCVIAWYLLYKVLIHPKLRGRIL